VAAPGLLKEWYTVSAVSLHEYCCMPHVAGHKLWGNNGTPCIVGTEAITVAQCSGRNAVMKRAVGV